MKILYLQDKPFFQREMGLQYSILFRGSLPQGKFLEKNFLKNKVVLEGYLTCVVCTFFMPDIPRIDSLKCPPPGDSGKKMFVPLLIYFYIRSWVGGGTRSFPSPALIKRYCTTSVYLSRFYFTKFNTQNDYNQCRHSIANIFELFLFEKLLKSLHRATFRG